MEIKAECPSFWNSTAAIPAVRNISMPINAPLIPNGDLYNRGRSINCALILRNPTNGAMYAPKAHSTVLDD